LQVIKNLKIVIKTEQWIVDKNQQAILRTYIIKTSLEIIFNDIFGNKLNQ